MVMVPDLLTRRQERDWVDRMIAKVVEQDRRRRVAPADEGLTARAVEVASRWLDPQVGRPVRPASVAWVNNQHSRWASCTPDEGTIRLSHRLQAMPGWVVEYVLMHELCHLLETNHTPRFHQLVSGYPHSQRAKGYLEGWTAALNRPDAGLD